MNKLEHWKKQIQKSSKPQSQAISIFITPYSNLSVEGCVGIQEGLKNLLNLKKLSLEIREGNQIGIQGFQILGKALSNFELQELQLIFASELGLEDIAVKELFSQLNTSKTLTKFELEINEEYTEYNHLDIRGKYIKDFLKQQLNLKTLKIRYKDMLGNKGFQYFAEAIQELKQLNHLQIIFNSNLSLKGIKTFYDSLQLLPGLQKLQLSILTQAHLDAKQSKKGVDINGVKPICDLLNKLKQLTHLQLDIPQGYKMNQQYSQLLGVILSEHPKLYCLNLVVFDFQNAGLQGMQDLIRGISQCKRLIKLNIFIDRFNPNYSNRSVRNQLYHTLRLVNFNQYPSHIQYLKVQHVLQ